MSHSWGMVGELPDHYQVLMASEPTWSGPPAATCSDSSCKAREGQDPVGLQCGPGAHRLPDSPAWMDARSHTRDEKPRSTTCWLGGLRPIPELRQSYRQEYFSGQPFPSPGDLPNPGIEPRSPTLQVDALLSEPPGRPENTGVGSLSLLQWIFPIQESNPGLLHCRRIFYQLS